MENISFSSTESDEQGRYDIFSVDKGATYSIYGRVTLSNVNGEEVTLTQTFKGHNVTLQKKNAIETEIFFFTTVKLANGSRLSMYCKSACSSSTFFVYELQAEIRLSEWKLHKLLCGPHGRMWHATVLRCQNLLLMMLCNFCASTCVKAKSLLWKEWVRSLWSLKPQEEGCDFPLVLSNTPELFCLSFEKLHSTYCGRQTQLKMKCPCSWLLHEIKSRKSHKVEPLICGICFNKKEAKLKDNSWLTLNVVYFLVMSL